VGKHIQISLNMTPPEEAADRLATDSRFPVQMNSYVFSLVVFGSDDHCRYFFPQRSAEWHRAMNARLAQIVQNRHGTVARFVLTPEYYHAWRGHRCDSPELRSRCVEELSGLLHPLPQAV
jgi:hypothetical protein